MALVTEAAASAIIDRLVDTVLNYANTSWWTSSRDVKAEAEKLQAALPQIRLVLAAVQVDRIRQKNPDFDARLWQFRDALEAADDVLDEIKYYELEEKVKARNSKVSGPISGRKRKLVDFFKSAFVNDGVLGKLREAVKGLEAIARSVGPFLELANSLNKQLVVNNFRAAGSYLTETKSSVIGREKEKETIVKWLIAASDGDSQGLLSFFSVFGTGGMGKTTLLQLVCNDQRVVENFDQVLWICISDNSSLVDAKTMIKRIIEDITMQSCNLDNVNTLQNFLKEQVSSKKFLLVLDDVWRDDTLSEWEKMMAPLKFGKKGSKILLTTRMESVAKMIAGVVKRMVESENKYLELTGLGDNDFMTLFQRYAFAYTNSNEHPHHEIGNQIAKKLRACPLFAKIIGGVLNSSFNFDFWNKILNEDIVNIQASEDYVMDILKLSYYHLPTHLQLCFRYCSIFPQDYKFTKVELTKIWVGSGLISWYAPEKRSPEDVADEYLDQLAGKSFFSIEPNNINKGYTYFIHDLLHDLARCVSKDECLRITGDDIVAIPPTIRHLSIETKNSSILVEIRNHNKLKSLVISCVDNDLDWEQLNEILSEVKSLRLLKLSIGEHMIVNTIGDLMHLRYLSITCDKQHTSSIQVLVSLKSLYRLYHLQVLQVQTGYTCSWNMQESEMEDMCNLISLRYLDLPPIILRNIPWIGKMSSLQELNTFHVRNESGYKIVELKYLTDLRRLVAYNLKDIGNPDEALEAKMSKKKNMKSLELDWVDPYEVRGIDEKVADNLKPATNLVELKIRNYSGVRSPSWMIDCSCCNLTSVTLSRCYRWEHLPPLGHLNSLKFLVISDMRAVKQVSYSLYDNSNTCVFPSLRRLAFSYMSEWEEWIGINDKSFFPCLDELEIIECPKLKRLPTLPLSLSRLIIINAGLDTLPGLFQAPRDRTIGMSSVLWRSSLSYLEVRRCPNISTLVGCQLLQQPENLHALQKIYISKCQNLLHIPTEFFAKLPSLTDFTMMDCPNLSSHKIKLSTMLINLTIGSCRYPEHSFIRSL